MTALEKINIDNSISTPLIPACTAIETFRDSGYKNTASALAELIDNSIEAEAKNIQVLTFEESTQGRRRTIQKIVKVAVYDDGKGMNPETLQLSLQFGVGTRMTTRQGMGRFGIGLPNASVSQCRRVQVYSWQQGKCHTTYLDVDETKEHKKQDANPVTDCNMPTEILEHIEGGYDKDSGTLIIWDKCDRLDVARSSTLYRNMEKDLCRIYRHFLDNDNSYGNKVSIKLIVTGKEKHVLNLKANDPLYILTPNNLPGYEDQQTNEEQKMAYFDMPYDEDGNTSRVEIRFSVALPAIQSLGGNSVVGKHYAHNTGISFVRACREIDFGDFGFVTDSDPRQRWWGCEVRFEPVLDELFGVANNKQSIRGIRKLDIKQLEEDNGDDWEQDLKDDPKLLLRYELSKRIENNLKRLNETIRSRNEGSKSKDIKQPSKATQVANDVLQTSKEETKSHLIGSTKTQEEKDKEWLEKIQKSEPDLTPDELMNIAKEKAKSKIDMEFSAWPGEQFFTIQTYGETPVVVINTSHPFYTDLYEPLSKGDSTLTDAIDLMMMAYARTEDELFSYSDELEKIRSRWGGHVHEFLKALKKSV